MVKGVKTANWVYLEFVLGAITKHQIVQWAAQLLTSVDPLCSHPGIIAIAELCVIESIEWNIQPEDVLSEIVSIHFADFKIPSSETESMAQEILREKCAGFLLGTLIQSEFFAVINSIHRYFGSLDWLGQLYFLSKQSRIYAGQENFENDLRNEIKVRLTEL